MIKFLSKTLITSVAVLIASFILSGVTINSTATAILVAVVLGLLNSFIKPILIILTIPITILTLGLFLLVINVIIIKWTSELVHGFHVNGWITALLFSIIVSFVSSLIEGLINNQTDQRN
jgi:putative membrane protein